jgi:hypothetical protein
MTYDKTTSIKTALQKIISDNFDFGNYAKNGKIEKSLLTPIVDNMTAFLCENTGEKFAATAYYVEPSYYSYKTTGHIDRKSLIVDEDISTLYFGDLEMMDYFSEQDLTYAIRHLPTLIDEYGIKIIDGNDSGEMIMAKLRDEQFISLLCNYNADTLEVQENELTYRSLKIMSDKDWDRLEDLCVFEQATGLWNEVSGYDMAAVTNIINEIYEQWQTAIAINELDTLTA